MKVQRDSRKQKGFTLVELLIVIVIIGILAGSMMMLMGSSTDKAEATKVISDLRTMKGAMLQYYADNSEYPDASVANPATQLEAYVDKDLADGYSLLTGSGTSADIYYVGRMVPNTGALEKFIETVRNDNSKGMWIGTVALLTTEITDSAPAATPAVASPSTTYVYSQVN